MPWDLWDMFTSSGLDMLFTGKEFSYMINQSALPANPKHKIYWGGIEALKVYFGGEWKRLIVMSVRLCYTSQNTQFVRYKTRMGSFVFVTDKRNGNYAALIPAEEPNSITTKPVDYFWLCLQHSTITDITQSKFCRDQCRCGASDHCIERYFCVNCGDRVNATSQLCGKFRCSNPNYN